MSTATVLKESNSLQNILVFHVIIVMSVFRCFRKITENDFCLRQVWPSTWNSSNPTGRIFLKFDFSFFFRKSVEKIQGSLKSEKNSGALDEQQHIFWITSRSFLLKMRNVSDEFIHKVKIQFHFDKFFSKFVLLMRSYRRPLGRPTHKWEDIIKLDVKQTGWDFVKWIHVAQDRDRCFSLVNTVLNFLVPWNAHILG